jgi:hypothetical protein
MTPRRLRLALVLAVPVAVLAACSGGTHQPAAPLTTSAPGRLQPAADPRPSPRAALQAFLEAEQRGDHGASLALVSSKSRAEYPTPADWARRRRELPAITGFHLEADNVAVVEHEPGLDPFVGLSPARERQTWMTEKEGAGYLLDAQPEVDALIPPDETARAAALSWAEALQACDSPRAKALQAVPYLFGQSDGPARLCGAKGEVSAATAGRLSPGPRSADIVGQYGSDALSWARTVKVTVPGASFTTVLAPLGDTWKVLGVSEP